MRKHMRETVELIEREGFTVLKVDPARGKGGHYKVEFSLGPVVTILIVGAKDTDRKKRNFQSDLRKIKRELTANGEATRDIGSPA